MKRVTVGLVLFAFISMLCGCDLMGLGKTSDLSSGTYVGTYTAGSLNGTIRLVLTVGSYSDAASVKSWAITGTISAFGLTGQALTNAQYVNRQDSGYKFEGGTAKVNNKYIAISNATLSGTTLSGPIGYLTSPGVGDIGTFTATKQ